MFIQIIESFAYGSAKSVKQLVSLLSDFDEVVVFYGCRDGSYLEETDLDPRAVWIELKGKGLFKHFQNIIQIYRYVSRKNASSVSVHGHSTFGGIYSKALSLIRKVKGHKDKVFYSPRGYAFLRQDFSFLLRRFFYLIEYVSAPLVHCVSCGDYEYELSMKLPYIDNSLIHNSLNIPGTNQYECGEFVLSIGRICHQKGFDTFLSVAPRFPDTKFIWIGSGDPLYLSKFNEIPKNVEIMPYMEQSKLFEMMKKARLIFQPSRWEGLSRTLLESLVLGIPLVTSDFKGNIDCLNYHNGSFTNGYSCISVDDYYNAIFHLLNDKDAAIEMSNESRALAMKKYDYEVVKRKWLLLYNKCS